jgi:glycerol-3-phosphate dehydrogenase (NAD(P)+)
VEGPAIALNPILSSSRSTAQPQVVAVLGAGSWGTSLAYLTSRKNYQTRLWARDEEVVLHFSQNGENAKYLPGTHIPSVEVSADLRSVLEGASWIVIAVPGAAVPELAQAMQQLGAVWQPDTILVSGTKGLDPETGLRPSQLWAQHAGWPSQNYAALSGPNLAKEIVADVPTSSVVASQNQNAAQRAQELFSSQVFRVYTNCDLIGVEMGGALKNIVAIAAGIAHGLGFGDNSKAALMTRAWREMTRLSVAMGAQESTLYGMSGMGDLIATCMSPHSRNHRLGCYLARGESLLDAQHEVAQVAEGVHTTRAALRLAEQTGVELPVTQQLARVLFEGQNPRDAVNELMNRHWRGE